MKARREKIGYSLSIKAKNSITYILGSKPKVDKKQAKLYKEAQASGVGLGVEGEEGELAGSPEQSAEKDSSASSSMGMSKLRSKPG